MDQALEMTTSYNDAQMHVDYFAVYIANRVSHVDSYHLLAALRERLDEKWPSSSDSSNRYSE